MWSFVWYQKYSPAFQVVFDETIDKNFTLLNGGGGIDPTTLPLDPTMGCTPVYPHSYNKLNTIFEVTRFPIMSRNVKLFLQSLACLKFYKLCTQ